MKCAPASPSGISSVIAASGPYAALVSASRPKIGIPAATPMCSARSSLVAKGFPIIESVNDIRFRSYCFCQPTPSIRPFKPSSTQKNWPNLSHQYDNRPNTPNFNTAHHKNCLPPATYNRLEFHIQENHLWPPPPSTTSLYTKSPAKEPRSPT